LSLVSITSSEPDDASGDGHTTGDIQGAALGGDDRTFQLRSERQGGGSGRIYTITEAAADHSGNATTAQATVKVPHDRGH
jgi:endo-1,4-beta-xylanase